MHEPVKGRLEEYLRGGCRQEVEDHLRACAECRAEVDGMRAQANLFAALKAPAGLEPSAGFYARVMNRVETQAKPSPWSLFGESLFAKRLVYASVTFLVLLGTFFVSSAERESTVAESVLVGEELPPPVNMNPQDRDVILVNLASFQQDYQ